MAFGEFVLTGLGAIVVSSLELSFRAGRHPFGDTRQKALGWWLAVALIDVAIACLLALGMVALPENVSVPTGVDAAAFSILLGMLGPLALRSPIRKAQVDDREVAVGLTYIYDVARVRALYALDDRMSWLLRVDVQRVCQVLDGHGVSPADVARAIREHAADHRGLSKDERDLVEVGVVEVLALPEDVRMAGLVKLARRYRFRAVLDNLAR